MQENKTTISAVIKPSQSVWYTSIGLFVIIFWISLFFGISSWFLDKSNETLQWDIQKIEADITKLSEDRKILIANIIKNNTLRPSIPLGEIILNFKMAAAQANVRLKWFDIANDMISTSLIATEWDPGIHPDPVATIIKMMQTYAKEKMDFSLDPIISISGDPTLRTTGIQFHVLSNNNK